MTVVPTQFAGCVTLMRDKVESFERYPFSRATSLTHRGRVLDILMDRRTRPPPPPARKLGVVVDVKVCALSELWSGL